MEALNGVIRGLVVKAVLMPLIYKVNGCFLETSKFSEAAL